MTLDIDRNSYKKKKTSVCTLNMNTHVLENTQKYHLKWVKICQFVVLTNIFIKHIRIQKEYKSSLTDLESK